MRVHLHDFSGHPFQAELARHLAGRGHQVVHGYCDQYVTGRGRLSVEPGDPSSLSFVGFKAPVPLRKYSPLQRTSFELAYARVLRAHLAAERPDVVIACNIPLFALAALRWSFARRNQPWVFWHQDVYSQGVAAEAERRLPAPVAKLVRARAEGMERTQVGSADAVVAIGPGFLGQYEQWGLPTDSVRVIPNWAPLDDIVPGDRDNAWSRRQGLPLEPVRLLYAGTLGRKHNPLLLLALLDEVRARGVDAVLTVVSEGVGADDLAQAAAGRPDVRILGFQPVEDFADVLASADAVVTLLEPDAATYSVPSKVLSYLSAGRPIVALVPDGNPCAADVLEAGGCVSTPTPEGARAAANWIVETVEDRSELVILGKRARALAEERFDIAAIGDQFEEILVRAARGPAPRSVQVGSGGTSLEGART